MWLPAPLPLHQRRNLPVGLPPDRHPPGASLQARRPRSPARHRQLPDRPPHPPDAHIPRLNPSRLRTGKPWPSLGRPRRRRLRSGHSRPMLVPGLWHHAGRRMARRHTPIIPRQIRPGSPARHRRPPSRPTPPRANPELRPRHHPPSPPPNLPHPPPSLTPSPPNLPPPRPHQGTPPTSPRPSFPRRRESTSPHSALAHETGATTRVALPSPRHSRESDNPRPKHLLSVGATLVVALPSTPTPATKPTYGPSARPPSPW